MRITIDFETCNDSFAQDLNGELGYLLAFARSYITVAIESGSGDFECKLPDSFGNSCGSLRGIEPVSRQEMIARSAELAKAVRCGAERIRSGAGCLRCGEAAERHTIGETCSACGAGVVERVRS